MCTGVQSHVVPIYHTDTKVWSPHTLSFDWSQGHWKLSTAAAGSSVVTAEQQEGSETPPNTWDSSLLGRADVRH